MLPLFLAESVAGETVVLIGEEARHAASVVRLRIGERITVSDGESQSIEGVVISVAKYQVEIEVKSRFSIAAFQLKVTVAQALAKGDSSSTAVALLTEVGVDEILPWSAHRSIAKWDGEKIVKGRERWETVARESTKQSRRIAIPKIGTLQSIEDLVARVASADCAIVLHESAEEVFGRITIPRIGEVLLIVGPEGGIDESELEIFKAAGAHLAVLGPTVFRSSHAGSIGAALVISGRW
jgi:16S rRNA (uracil1498-N3)-methyltransferase